MSLSRRLVSRVIGGLTSPGFRNLRRRAAEVRRRLRRQPHRVLYFHEVEDPYSHLAAQTLGRLLARYDVALVPHLVGEAEAAPQRDLLAAYARQDAAAIAPAYGLKFPRDTGAPDAELVRRGTRLLANAPSATFVARAAQIGAALWAGDRGAMERLGQELPNASEDEVRAARAKGSALRKRLGHYSGAMFHYGGEWYWGVDRLSYLEERLRDLGLARDPAATAPIVPRPEPTHRPVAPASEPLVLEYFPSLRSPYSYISMERVYDLARRYGLTLRLRPVLPMVMRGLAVPAAKRLYILFDTKREAEREGVAFGTICDPVGKPVERAFSLYRFACEHDRAAEYLLSFARGVFAEGVDAGTEDGLRRIAERAGLAWSDAQASRADDGWRADLEANRQAMFAAGLWGVPSFQLLADGRHAAFATWGQDRIWLLEQEIQRRLA
jgi:2-hydroxychromene-2-carboxylate isomerase